MSNDKHINGLEDLDEFIELPKQSGKGTKKDSVNDIYRKNLEALSTNHPEVVEMMDSVVIDEEKIRVFSSESGNPRIVYKKEDGEEVNIHSAEDPVECANNAIELLGRIEKEGIVVLFGFGFGYFAEEMFEKFEKGHILLVYEANPEIFKLALMTRDLSGLLDSERVKIVLGADTDNFSVIYSHHHLISNGKFWVVRHNPSVKLNPDAYDNFLKRLDEEKRLSDLGIATVISRGKEFINAFIENVPSVIRSPGANKLKDIFKGIPAVIVSAGPSLNRNMHMLRKIKGRAVIIATDASIPTLLSAGISPDIAVAIDPVSDNIDDKFKDIPVLKNLPFICLAQYTPELIHMYPGHLFVNSVPQNVAYQWLSGYWEDKGYIESFGGSVAHLAFAAAEFMGSDVIAFLGQDLSYTGDRIHAIGYSDNLDRILEEPSKKETDGIPGETTAVDIFNESVHTIRQFTTFKTSFENKIKNFKGEVLNLTEGGLPIDGAATMRFMDFIDEYCSNLNAIDTYSILSGLSDSVSSYNLDGLINEVAFAKNKYDEIKKSSRQILKYIKRVESLKKKNQKDSPELHNILRKVGILTEKVKHPALDILSGYHYGLELYLKKQEIQEVDHIEDKWEKLDKQIKRGKVYYSEIINAINLFNKQIDRLVKALSREKEIDAILNDGSIEQGNRFYKAGMIYKRNGMTSQAVKYLEAVRDSQGSETRSQEILLALAEMYMKQFKFYEVREILADDKTQETNSKDKEKIAELLKTCNKKINEWETRKKTMDKLLKEAEVDYGSHLESGYFYFRVNDFERAEKSYLKAIESQKSGVRSQEKIAAAYYGLAHTYLSIDDHEKAVDALEKAIETEPANPVFYRDLGFISFNNNDIASAEIFFIKAIELSPQTAELYKPLADLYMVGGEREKAVNIYEQALKVNPDAPVIKQELAVLLGEKISEAGIC